MLISYMKSAMEEYNDKKNKGIIRKDEGSI